MRIMIYKISFRQVNCYLKNDVLMDVNDNHTNLEQFNEKICPSTFPLGDVFLKTLNVATIL